ncbi:NtaA/DmoA family FMN-dependent monooxygenase [Acidisphaera sp. L21]|uniref:NtaA/DmoA family FMN-dependent monooxygenase n=1 Tax=Acidisphaera sp. L21 TaxID=1641851 RepID=UPI00131EBA98|nr:NtaA/DmoA family FMN-dependent monooxygenase [Acidisphaera sp. L21]
MKNGYMKLGLMPEGAGRTGSDWLNPGMPSYPGTNFEKHKQQALIAEEFKADFFFVADTLWADEGSPPHRLDRFEATTLLAALAAVTTNIGLVGTMSTTFCEPFNIARQILSLDHLSNGRAGWNLVTTDPKGSSDNYGRFHGISHRERYEIGAEAYHVVTGLWDSFEDDALPQDKESGVFLLPDKLHTLDHKGKYFESKGPLNLHRSPQGRPIIFTATASDEGLAFAARYADCVFTTAYAMEVNQASYRKLKAKALEYGRDPNSVSLLPSCAPLIAPTREAAQAIQAGRRQTIGLQGAINYLSGSFHGFDLRKYGLDDPFPLSVIESLAEGFKGNMMQMLRVARDEALTVRQFVMRFGFPKDHFVGTAEDVADEMQQWIDQQACDGFMLIESQPGQLRMFADFVAPLLRERGLLRREYPGTTLRETLGLPRPENQFVAARSRCKPVEHDQATSPAA